MRTVAPAPCGSISTITRNSTPRRRTGSSLIYAFVDGRPPHRSALLGRRRYPHLLQLGFQIAQSTRDMRGAEIGGHFGVAGGPGVKERVMFADRSVVASCRLEMFDDVTFGENLEAFKDEHGHPPPPR